ncbi:MAG: DegV family protein [Clostridia bacterium]|nr:DegV family protein [Clostridia bacterium]
MLTLFTDTDTDITPEVAKEYGYRLISMPYSIDAKTIWPYEDFDVFDSRAFYDSLRSGVLPTTGGISAERYKDYFRPEFEKGNDILYVHFSAAMTVTFRAMDEAVDALLKEFPERKFYHIDTKGITIVSYNLVRTIGDLYQSGKTAEELIAWADREVLHYAQYFFADDLKFFKRSGRVKGIAATMGTLLGIRPIICMNDAGEMVSIGKERGRANAMERLLKTVEELGDDIKNHRFIVGHTDAPEIAAELVDMLHARFGDDLSIETVVTNPTAGSHCGPNGVGVSFHASRRC